MNTRVTAREIGANAVFQRRHPGLDLTSGHRVIHVCADGQQYMAPGPCAGSAPHAPLTCTLVFSATAARTAATRAGRPPRGWSRPCVSINSRAATATSSRPIAAESFRVRRRPASRRRARGLCRTSLCRGQRAPRHPPTAPEERQILALPDRTQGGQPAYLGSEGLQGDEPRVAFCHDGEQQNCNINENKEGVIPQSSQTPPPRGG